MYFRINKKIIFILLTIILLSNSSCKTVRIIREVFLPKETDYKVFPYRTIERDTVAHIFPVIRREAVDIGRRILLDNRPVTPSAETLDIFSKKHKNMAFIILRNDSILYETYRKGMNEATTMTSFSAAKAFVSTLVGIAISEKYIGSEQDYITKYLPELHNKGYDSIRIEHLLNHTSGIRYDPGLFTTNGNYDFYWRRNLREHTFHLAVENKPGVKFRYLNVNTQLLGLIIERATHQTMSHYLQEKIWKPLGMESSGSWSTDEKGKRGIEKAFCCINARARDFARFGQLYLQNGVWNGKQIVPAAWINKSIHGAPSAGGRRTYRYNWGIAPRKYGSFYAIGLYGQFIYVYPEKNIVIVRFGKRDLNYNPSYWAQIMLQLCDQL